MSYEWNSIALDMRFTINRNAIAFGETDHIRGNGGPLIHVRYEHSVGGNEHIGDFSADRAK
ncbi:hypothetical protein [Paraburkholderia phenoliruptrix]|uniref:hypothetical protein n=1 Tax=Paraburkholderia phenoliruptrix TaxID=252970 RepID=UPI0015831F78|nr:hypothetical protein [Paraburkholderia phenoliruptrix]